MVKCGKPCDCPSLRDHYLSISIAPSATPTRNPKEATGWKKETEAKLSRDMPAYKRLRDEGIQPRSIMDSERWEATARDRLEIETASHFGEHLPIVREFADNLIDKKAQ